MDALNLERHTVCPAWNYTLHPRSSLSSSHPAEQELIV